MKKRKSDRFGLVRFVGTRNEKYFLINEKCQVERKDLSDPENINVGDIVIFDKACDLPIEYELHQSTETLFRMHRCNLKAIVEQKFLPRLGIAVQTRHI
jgi:hypothetical protein